MKAFTQQSQLLKALLVLAFSLALACGIPTTAAAQSVDNERSQTTPGQGNRWFYNKTIAQINGYVNQGYRLIDIEIESINHALFSGTMVKNTGDHQKEWAWYVGLTIQQIEDTAFKYHLRPIDIEVFYLNNSKYAAVVFAENSGDQHTNWRVLTDRTANFLKTEADQTAYRITDLDYYKVDGNHYYSAVMVKNTGKNYKDWRMYVGETLAFIKDKMDETGMRIVDAEKGNGGVLTAILEESAHPEYQGKSQLFVVTSTDRISEVTRHYGARIVDFEHYLYNGEEDRFIYIILNNSNALTTTVGDYMRDNIGGTIKPYNDDPDERGHTVGFRLKEVNGPVKASLQWNRKFYPASTMKVLEHWYLMKYYEEQGVDLNNTSLNMCRKGSANCTNNINDWWNDCDSSVTLNAADRSMMRNSSNRATNSFQDFFGNGVPVNGRNNVNQALYNVVGLSTSTAIKHKLGCDNVDSPEPNTMTMKDITTLYEKVFSDNNVLLPATRTAFVNNMLNDQNTNGLLDRLKPVIDEEAAKLNIHFLDKMVFMNGIEYAYKGGNIGSGYKSIAGWIRIPYNCGSPKEFVFGSFWDKASDLDKQNTGEEITPGKVIAQLLRDEIRKGLQACHSPNQVYNGGNGNPLDKATITLEKDMGRGIFAPINPSSDPILMPLMNPMQTDRNGRFEWDILASGTYRVKATAAGFSPAYSDTFTVDAGYVMKGHRIALEPICPPTFIATTCPDQYITSNYKGRSVAQITASASGGMAPYTYQWDGGELEQVMEKVRWVAPEIGMDYTVTVTDANGCKATAVHTVHVVDISCTDRKGNIGVQMCYQSATGLGWTRCVPEADVAAKLASGNWVLGSCGSGMDFTGGSCGNPQALPTGSATGAKMGEATLSTFNAFPNPFSQTATVEFSLTEDKDVSLEVFDVNGARVTVLMEQAYRPAGAYQATFDGRDLAAGVYMVVLRGEGLLQTKRIVLAK